VGVQLSIYETVSGRALALDWSCSLRPVFFLFTEADHPDESFFPWKQVCPMGATELILHCSNGFRRQRDCTHQQGPKRTFKANSISEVPSQPVPAAPAHAFDIFIHFGSKYIECAVSWSSARFVIFCGGIRLPRACCSTCGESLVQRCCSGGAIE
jgi:hypothetical protein